jgi:hypothetical protein
MKVAQKPCGIARFRRYEMVSVSFRPAWWRRTLAGARSWWRRSAAAARPSWRWEWPAIGIHHNRRSVAVMVPIREGQSQKHESQTIFARTSKRVMSRSSKPKTAVRRMNKSDGSGRSETRRGVAHPCHSKGASGPAPCQPLEAGYQAASGRLHGDDSSANT